MLANQIYHHLLSKLATFAEGHTENYVSQHPLPSPYRFQHFHSPYRWRSFMQIEIQKKMNHHFLLKVAAKCLGKSCHEVLVQISWGLKDHTQQCYRLRFGKTLLVCSIVKSCPTLPSQRLQHVTSQSTISQSLHKWMSIESMIPSIHLLISLSPTSPLVFNLPQQRGLFQWVRSLHQVDKILELQL